ncbi:MAG: site-specific integrase [Clostridia bacterium]|nr:site-specific integrase [Clostridia bacterium]
MATKAKGKYYRQKVRHPVTGEYRDVYAKSRPELKTKCDALEAAWAREIEDADSPYFFQYAADWFEREKGHLSEQRRSDVAREINGNICPVIGGKKLREITSDDVAAVMAGRAGLSRSAQSKTLQILKRILSSARRAKKIPEDPSAEIRAGGKSAPPKLALTPEQEQTLLAAVEGLPVELFIRLALYAGLRREEICGLMWRDVHLDGAAPHIDVRQAARWPQKTQAAVQAILKRDASWRTVPVPPALLGALRAARAAQKGREEEIRSRCVVTSGAGEPWSFSALRRAWDSVEARSTGTVIRRRKNPATGKTVKVEVEKRLGDRIPKHPGCVVTIDFPVTPHLLRHTYITRLILGGVDVKRVQYLAGHRSATTTLDIYTSLMGHQPEDLIDDVSAIFPG